jgi:hypothetical protein
MRRALCVVLLLSLGGCDLFEGAPPADPGVPSVEDRSPVPGAPPIVWVGGSLQEIAEGHLTILGESEAIVRLQRLAEGTTRFLVADGDAWRDLSSEETARLEVGPRICAEVLLDGTNLVALRVFLDASCGPTGAP